MPRLIALALALAIANSAHGQSSSPRSTCYRVAYDPPDPSLPSLITLIPGHDSGAVVSQTDPADTIQFWRMFQNSHAYWVRSASDSVQLNFDNGFTFVTFNLVQHRDSLLGTTVIDYDFGDPKQHPRLIVRAAKTPCQHP